MEETPEATATNPTVVSTRAPLGVRVIAGLFLLFGLATLVHGLLSYLLYGDESAALGFLLVPVGWGLLRRRIWARLITLALIVILMVGGGIGLLFIFAYVITCLSGTAIVMGGSPSPDVPNLIVVAVQLATMISLFTYFRSRRVVDWFHCSSPLRPYVVWHARRWRFGMGTLFFLTLLVAVSSMTVIMHPAVRAWRGHQWLAAQDFSDPIYFPSEPSPLPPYFSESSSSWGLGQDRVDVYWQISPAATYSNEPELGYVVINHMGETGDGPSRAGAQSMGGMFWRTEFTWHENTSIKFPGPVRIVEYKDGRFAKSDMHIALLEFWSFLHHPNSTKTLEGLETYVKDLRQRVAERDTKRTSHP